MESTLVLILMFASLVVLMLTGAGLAFVLGAIAFLVTALLWGPGALIVTVLNTFDTMTSESLMAIPLYVLMAAILQKSGIIDDLYTAMEKWFGRVSGGLAIGTVVICTIMAAIDGRCRGCGWRQWASSPCPRCWHATTISPWRWGRSVPAARWAS